MSRLGKILFVVPYPKGTAASQRFRFEQYLDILNKAGWEYEYHSFLSPKAWKILYLPGNVAAKALEIFLGFCRRMLLLTRIKQFDYVFIHRETAPLGPPVFEWVAAKLFGAKIIYDFDDAIWIPNVSESNRVFGFLKRYKNTESLSRLAYKVSCGNAYLCEYAKKFNPNVVLNPTTIDTENLHKPNTGQIPNHKPIIGWTGTHSTIRYMNEILPILKELENTIDFEFRVISDRKPDFELKSLKYLKWNESTEIADLSAIDFGIMPLVHDQWSEGKCGFKALQYMSLGKPALVSPVGVNTEIVDNGVDGFVCATPAEWLSAFNNLLTNPTLLNEMGSRTRRKVENRYSVKSNTANFLKLFS